MAGYITTEQFIWGLDRVLDGLSTIPGAVPDSNPHQ
jgi:hypothetical protein